ncbi:GIY-YIG nuclease family protein [Pseudocolwellia sp. HL-MZ19]|uniref:GIY-YIG nuclease family protein n=1 Tax=Pseudocolwellia sp. HL-MZ19 TaxID=3400846 RepID=UPI003CF8ADF6
MIKGRQIKIYLADGSVTGIRHAEIMGWTGQALALPRNRVKELTDWEESLRPGIYFLFGVDSETGNDAVYIGEAEQVAGRIQQHLSGKDFWNHVVCFTNKDENLTKAHVKYLESRLVTLSNRANRYELLNGNQPPQTTLPRGDKDVMEEFIGNIRILIGALGYRLLEPLVSDETNAVGEKTNIQFETFSLKAKKYDAKAKQTNEGIVVLSGSEASLTAKPSLSKGYTKVRVALIEKGKLIEAKDKLIFHEDVLFTSPSQAAAVLLGTPCNGLEYWVDNDGVSLKQKESSR